MGAAAVPRMCRGGRDSLAMKALKGGDCAPIQSADAVNSVVIPLPAAGEQRRRAGSVSLCFLFPWKNHPHRSWMAYYEGGNILKNPAFQSRQDHPPWLSSLLMAPILQLPDKDPRRRICPFTSTLGTSPAGILPCPILGTTEKEIINKILLSPTQSRRWAQPPARLAPLFFTVLYRHCE